MYFKRLELVGFKSFMNKTTLNFEPGVTAVVGPNGCGKSNIFDAIRWVLGEQSVKSLRGSDMQDVIFNGTDSQAAVGMAEVSLAFANEQRFFNLDNDEVIITRRLFRSGESEYLLNKTQVRLKDVMDLLMGTGIGAESYSIVAQGKIDLILSSKPEERRMVFDEASGITKYKSQKKEALRKLEETEQNLLRINDIISEVQRSIGHLERQANKARRYKELFEELKTKDIILSLYQKNDLIQKKGDIESQISVLKAEEEALLNNIKEEEAKIELGRQEVKVWEDNTSAIKNEIFSLENLILRNKQHVAFNQERIAELGERVVYLNSQIKQVKARIAFDEDKLNKFKEEYSGIQQNIQQKCLLLRDNEIQLNSLILAIKVSLEVMAEAKRCMLDLVTKIAQAKNEASELNSQHNIQFARQKRLELEKNKTNEERKGIETSLNNIIQEINQTEEVGRVLGVEMSNIQNETECQSQLLNQMNCGLDKLEKQRLTLESQKEFLEKLKTEYEGIDTSMNALIYLDKAPSEKIGGLVVKIKEYLNIGELDKAAFSTTGLKLSAEAKPVDLDTGRVTEKIAKIKEEIEILKTDKAVKEAHIESLRRTIQECQEKQKSQEIALGNKKTVYQGIVEQFNKIKEEEELIALELSDINEDIFRLEGKLKSANKNFLELENKYKEQEAFIHIEQEKVSVNSHKKEEFAVAIAKVKAELDSLNKQLGSEDSTLKILEDTFSQDKENLENLEKQIGEAKERQDALSLEMTGLNKRINQTQEDIKIQSGLLKDAEIKYIQTQEGLDSKVHELDARRQELDGFKDKVYSLQITDKDLDFKATSIKDRIYQAYKIDLDAQESPSQEFEVNVLCQEIEKFRNKLDSYGQVNLVAIEEYDELKKRYDFLTQQQNDLVTSKSSLQEAIQKINRTTRKMFMDTFEKVHEEFRKYFRMLFNGGDARLFLIDENDPLESGIEIICRPPGKKLQNVLLLSGGEKSMSAIALIFAIFKVKPAPFCILDEIDAALDEANVDRFSRILQEFTQTSQFIVVTHNKRTIANADVMYGITMEQSGVSKIVSVKFSSNSPEVKKNDEPQREAVVA